MSKVRIELKFDKLLTDLVGNPLGRNTFQKQVLPYFDENKEYVLVVPSAIHDVGSSYVQGIYAQLAEKYGKKRALEMIEFDCENKEILEKIKKSIRTYGI